MIQIFATDLGDPAVARPRAQRRLPGKHRIGGQPRAAPPVFHQRGSHLPRSRSSVRDVCVFARQNITVDPPFSRVDLVSCRNVLIYMSTAMQERLLPVFHFALNQAGFLMLGTRGDRWPVRRLVRARQPPPQDLPPQARRPPPSADVHGGRVAGRRWSRRPVGRAGHPPDFPSEADRLALGHYAPPCVLVNQRLRHPAVSRADGALPGGAVGPAHDQRPAPGDGGAVRSSCGRPLRKPRHVENAGRARAPARLGRRHATSSSRFVFCRVTVGPVPGSAACSVLFETLRTGRPGRPAVASAGDDAPPS